MVHLTKPITLHSPVVCDYLSNAWARGFDKEQIVEDLVQLGYTGNFEIAHKFVELLDMEYSMSIPREAH